MKKILIISSNLTGHGHKSITESLLEQFNKYPDVQVDVIDGFELGGFIGLRIGKMYGTVTRNAKEVWKMVWDLSFKKPSLVNELTQLSIHDQFMAQLRLINPDLIISVHPAFNGSILNMLEENNLDIPLVTVIADLVSITPLWTDPRATIVICPTEESKKVCIKMGVPEANTRVTGFPIRAKFCDLIGTVPSRSYSSDRPLECLLMSGGEGSGNMSRIASILLKNFDCNVRIVAGRNAVLRKRLEKTLMEKFPGRVEVFGFVDNVQDLMLSSDLAVMRGSPNVIMEAVICNVPLLITGALPGQEEGNPHFIKKNKLGVVCRDLRLLKKVITALLANNAKKLNQIKEAQSNFRNPSASKNIVDIVMNIELKTNVPIPAKSKKSMIVHRANHIIKRRTNRNKTSGLQ